MRLLIRFQSDEWRSYAANLATDPEAWKAANPATLQLGPFDSVEVTRGRVVGQVDGEARELARCDRDEPWRAVGVERLYDRFELIAA